VKPERRGVLSVLKLRDFRRVWIAEVVSDVGNFITFIALALLIHDLTDKTFAVGIALALRSIPWFTLGPVAGVIVDRADRRVVMVVSDLARAILVTALAFTHTAGQAYALAFLSGCFGPFFRPARQALLPTIAPGENYVRALALSEIAHQSLHTVGPAIGGLAVLALGARHAFFLDAGTFVVSAALVVGVAVRGAPRARHSGLGEVVTDLKEGARFLGRERVLRSLVASRAATVFAGVGIIALLVGYIRDDLHRGAGSYGLALAMGGIGTVVLSIALARRGASVRRARWLALAAASPALYLLMAFRPGFVALLLLMLVEGAAVTGLALYDDMVVAERTPDEARGRVFGLSGASAELAEFVGALVFTALGDSSLGVPVAMSIAGGVAAGLGLLALAPALGELAQDDERRRTAAPGAEPAPG
jgi:MFS transporter, NRE family, putaive nickel resistance protein